jgi:Ni/Fe-hydrogenase subunit HybB-like protein
MPSGASEVLADSETYRSIGGAVGGIALRRGAPLAWWLALAAALGLCGLLAVSLFFLFWDGIAVWGNNIPVTWALDIVSYDWWIGIACGGLLVSGVLLLADSPVRGALNRIAETMAVIGAVAAGIYPIIHLGRPWLFYWTFPYPNSFALWPQFRSPLYWDAIDILSFLGIAVCFWFVGLLPDLAALRDRAWEAVRGEKGLLRAQLYGIAALGWRGSAVHWHRWLQTYRILAFLGVLVVMALQTGAAVMFAGTLEPGWHDTLLPVTYMAGALLAGTGMLSLLVVVVRHAFGLQALITTRHVNILAALLLGLALVNIYCLAASTFSTMLSGDSFALAAQVRRATGPVAWSFWMLVAAGLVTPLVFLVGALRRSPAVLAWVGGSVCAGIWGDHYTLIVATLQHDFLASSAHATRISFFEWATFAGSGGLFLLLLLLFFRLLPVVSITETRTLTGRTGAEGPGAAPWVGDADAPLWGVAGEFATEAGMAQALERLRAGTAEWRVDGFGPVASSLAAVALGLRAHSMRGFALGGGIAGAACMFAMCSYATVYDYVFDIGGRPRFSWPAFVVPTVSFGCLCAGLAVMAAMLGLNRLPRLNHPAFNIAGFGRASTDRFFAVAHTRAQRLEPEGAEAVLRKVSPAPLTITRVPR